MKVRWILLANSQQLQKPKVLWSLMDLLVSFQQLQKPKVLWSLMDLLANSQQLQKPKVLWSLMDLLVSFQQLQKQEVLWDLAVGLAVDQLVDRLVDHLYPSKRLRSSEAKKQGRRKLSRATVMGSLSQGLPFLPEEPQDRWVKMLAWRP